jgi:Zn-dependent protease with chaperone function
MLDKINSLINDTKSISLKTYFPQSYKLLNTEHSTLFDKKIIYNKAESEYYKSKIKNLDLDVFILKDNEPNAFTIPGLDNISLLKSNPMEFQTLGLEVLTKHPLTASIVNNKIVFNSDIKNFKVLVFLNSGLFKKIPDIDSRLAIVLHELGHWVYIKSLISSSQFEFLLQIIKPTFYTSLATGTIYDTKIVTTILIVIKVFLLAIVNIKNRQNEYEADQFAKSVGYGPQLQNALSLLAYNKEISKINIEDKNNFLLNFYDIISLLFSQHTHPPVHKRILSLNESIDIDIFNQLLGLLNPIDHLIKEHHGTICSFI